ncbi:ABC transporter permease [Thalassobaculum sp. OXR-137]|uniref:ABC transporter permease n=1 Tax=Thalassobaculum sp. OXR-137 TaxID=3100173 RepID=UPI002AC91E76|nr:ABC transporter permease [Thalassobaculum sp. OXR-137]WPZ36858.1 ABC transporter permease [Thalassobaculum sp. OXR-137]
MRRTVRDPLALLALLVLAALALAALFAPMIEAAMGLDSEAVDLFNRLTPPSAEHPLGTDELGRDLLLRLLEGGRVSLSVGLSAALVASGIGTLIGLASGFLGGRLDTVLMRIADGVIALPLLPLLIVLAAVDLSKLGVPPDMAQSQTASLVRLVVLVSLVGWPVTARLVRASTLSLRKREFVSAARALGYSPWRIALRHVLPNALGPILVAATLSVGNVVLFESVLSFLGLGVRPPTPSWGNMLTGAQELIWEAPRLAIWPGVLIFATVVSVNLLGDALRDRLDPRTARR